MSASPAHIFHQELIPRTMDVLNGVELAKESASNRDGCFSRVPRSISEWLRMSWIELASVFFHSISDIPPVFGQEDSTWIASGNGDWFDTQNWNGPIPNAVGDIARVQRPGIGSVSVDLTSPVSLGQLYFSGVTSFTLTGSNPLLFDNAGDSALLETRGIPRVIDYRVEVPLGITIEEN